MDKDAVKELTKEQIKRFQRRSEYSMNEPCTLPEFSALCDMALRSLKSAGSNGESGAEPDGWLHDDGYFTWNKKGGALDKVTHEASYAGWRKPFYLSAPPSVTSDRKDEQTEERDAVRLDHLEALCWSDRVGNGIAIFPCTVTATGERRIVLQALGDEDGSDLGDELSPTQLTLRAAIDAAIAGGRNE